MYILFVTLLSLIELNIELQGPEFKTIDECWQVATYVARSPEVFSVRCQLKDND